MPNLVQETLAKLRVMFSNAHSTPASHIPNFTKEELDYLDNTLKSELNIPDVWVQVAHNPGMTLEQIKDPDEITFLQNLKTLIDSRMDKPVPSDPSTSSITLGQVSTSPAERAAVSDQVGKETPAVVVPDAPVVQKETLVSGEVVPQDELQVQADPEIVEDHIS